MTITKIVPDERSNSLIVVANQRAYDWLVVLVHKLDFSPEESVRGGPRPLPRLQLRQRQLR
jgi:type II secretory pathway component GspD/PulD (secretin)